MSNLPILAALPSGSAADKDLLRAALVRDFIAWIDPDTDPQTVDTSDTVEGTIAPVIAWRGQFFWLDPDDASTAHDGVTCIVTFNSARYLISGVFYPGSALDRDLDTPPADEDNAYGDAYLVPAGASGDWADYEDHVAVWTSRGWAYSPPYDGRLLYISDEDGFVRYALSTWLDGLGNGQHQENSVPLSAMIGAASSLTIRVENQTTTAPPGSAAVGVAYIVGPSATGDWLGQDGKVAICEVADTFTLYAPQTGDKVFDKNLGYDVRWNGSAWVSAAGTIVGSASNSIATTRATTVGGTPAYDDYVNYPTTSYLGFNDTCSITYTAKRSGSQLRVRYRIQFEAWDRNDLGNYISSSPSGVRFPGYRGGVAIFRDSVSLALDVAPFPPIYVVPDGSGGFTWHVVPNGIEVEFHITAPDAAAHTYYVRLLWPVYLNYSTVNDAAIYPTYVKRSFIDIYEWA